MRMPKMGCGCNTCISWILLSTPDVILTIWELRCIKHSRFCFHPFSIGLSTLKANKQKVNICHTCMCCYQVFHLHLVCSLWICDNVRCLPSIVCETLTEAVCVAVWVTVPSVSSACPQGWRGHQLPCTRWQRGKPIDSQLNKVHKNWQFKTY